MRANPEKFAVDSLQLKKRNSQAKENENPNIEKNGKGIERQVESLALSLPSQDAFLLLSM